MTIFFLFAFYSAGAQGFQHYFRTTSVIQSNLHIGLEWTIPQGVSAANFSNYIIYHSEDYNGRYAPIDTITAITISDIIYIPANPLDPHYFFISTHYNVTDSITSDTLTQIRLNVGTDFGGSKAMLSWNAIDEIPFYNFTYEIYRQNTTGVPELIATTEDLSYTDLSFHNCDPELLTYQIILSDTQTGEKSRSSTDGEILVDITKPTLPEVRSVSVTHDGKIELIWEASPDDDIAGYIVYENKPPDVDFDALFTVYGTDTAFNTTNICSGAYGYVVSAIDFCENERPPDYDHPQRIIDLQDITTDVCRGEAYFNWSDYINMDPPLLGYRILEVDPVSGATTLLDETTESEFTLSTFFENNIDYCYQIEAYNQDAYTSNSCTVCITGYQPQRPDTISVTNATVTAPNEIKITWYADEMANTDTRYHLLRRNEQSGGNWVPLDTQSPVDGPEFTFYDNNVSTDQYTYSYSVDAIDTCGVTMSLGSPVAETILLSGSTPYSGTYELEWTDIRNNNAVFQEYYVIRQYPNVSDTVYRGTATAYTDIINDPALSAADITYHIVARLTQGNNTQIIFSTSNFITLASELKMLNFPNAFTPNGDGKNDTFGPIGFLNDLNVEKYALNIYNKWGQVVFKSNSYATNWNGKINGAEAPSGVYAYRVVLYTPQGNEINHNGTVVLIK